MQSLSNSIFEINCNIKHDGTIRIYGVLDYTDGSQTMTYIENKTDPNYDELLFKLILTAETGKSIKNIGCRIVSMTPCTVYLDNLSCKIIQ